MVLCAEGLKPRSGCDRWHTRSPAPRRQPRSTNKPGLIQGLPQVWQRDVVSLRREVEAAINSRCTCSISKGGSFARTSCCLRRGGRRRRRLLQRTGRFRGDTAVHQHGTPLHPPHHRHVRVDAPPETEGQVRDGEVQGRLRVVLAALAGHLLPPPRREVLVQVGRCRYRNRWPPPRPERPPACCDPAAAAAVAVAGAERARTDRGHQHGPLRLSVARFHSGRLRLSFTAPSSARHTERRIIKVRVLRRWGPARIAHLLRLVPSTVHRVLTHHGLARLSLRTRVLPRPLTAHQVRP